MDHASLVLLVAISLFTMGLVAAAVGLALGFGWRAERDVLRGEIRRLYEDGRVIASSPNAVRVDYRRIGTERDTVLPPPPDLPKLYLEPDEIERVTETPVCESVTRVIR